MEDAGHRESEHDFGHNVIPMLHESGKRIYAYPYSGYWRDVGAVQSYYDANMDLLDCDCDFDLSDRNFRVFSNNTSRHPQFIGPQAKISNSLICDGCIIFGKVENSILSHDVVIHKKTSLKNVIVHTGAIIEDGAILENCIVGARARIKGDARYITDPDDTTPEIHVINN